jgi:alanine racemase
MHRPTWAEIHLENLAFNLASVKKFVGQDLEYMAVVKADAYGHGAVECSKRLEKEGIDWLGVALPEEGVELRKNGVSTPILCLGSFFDGQETLVLDNDLTTTIYRLDLAERLNLAAKSRNKIVDIHIKIDTGMGRIGVRFDEVEAFVESLSKFENLNVNGLMTHFASADNLFENDFTNLQIQRFSDSCKVFSAKGYSPKYNDLANSPASIAHPGSRGNMVRIGGILYGLGGDVLPKNIEKPELKPVMSLRSRITYLKNVPKGETLGYSRTFQTDRKSVIATIPIGYQDGYLRGLSNCGRTIIRGQFANIVGRVSMDWSLVDVTDISDVAINDEVILIGESGDKKVTTEEIAGKVDTISYEVTCGISHRVRRIYQD